MSIIRKPMARMMPSKASVVSPEALQPPRYDSPRRVRNTLMDFSALSLPEAVRLALAEAFWEHLGVQAQGGLHTHWSNIKTFARFVRETHALVGLEDVNSDLLVRYVEWLNAQCRTNGQPWTKASRASAYATLRALLQWLERCRPGIIGSIEYPFNPFPWRNRDSRPYEKMPARDLSALLKACEVEITTLRTQREAAAAQRVATDGSLATLGGLLNYIDQHFDGIVPPARKLSVAGQRPARQALARFGGLKGVEPCLYPRAEALLPYYLAILIHTAGNPDPIAELACDCLQPIPLLEDREAIVWFKRRANSDQRRTFSSADRFAPPALVKEILAWSQRLRPLASHEQRGRLFLYKNRYGVSALTSRTVKGMLKPFCERHHLPRFSLAALRPSVLSSCYRVSGDLRKTQALANHAQITTTIGYVDTPQVRAENNARIAALQNAFIGHFGQRNDAPVVESAVLPKPCAESPVDEVTSMFGFNCTNPYEGAAPGTRRGELCMNFMGCFTCPNAIITQDPRTVAKLLLARDHLRAGAASLHPARWQACYAPQLRILEEDILPRFNAAELSAAQALLDQLPPLPALR